MIHTTKQNISRYYTVHPRLEKAVEAMLAMCAQPFSAGRHPVDGEDIYINAAEYDTKTAAEAVLEAHEDYIDVMLLLEGEEYLAFCDRAAAGREVRPYDAADDAMLAELPARYSGVFFRLGDFVILFPEDAHAPGIDTDLRQHVRKLIAKVRV